MLTLVENHLFIWTWAKKAELDSGGTCALRYLVVRRTPCGADTLGFAAEYVDLNSNILFFLSSFSRLTLVDEIM